jgi:hypothetical protein
LAADLSPARVAVGAATGPQAFEEQLPFGSSTHIVAKIFKAPFGGRGEGVKKLAKGSKPRNALVDNK